MSFAGFLYQRATIERPQTPVAADRVNAPTPAYTVAATGVPCRVVEEAEEMVLSSTAAGLLATRFSIRFLAGADVRPHDKVTLLTDHLGQATTPSYRVLTVRRPSGRHGAHHQVAYVLALGS